MKKEIRNESVYSAVKTGEKNVDVYIANNGREFIGKSAEKDCFEYDLLLAEDEEFSNIKTITHSFYMAWSAIPDTFYLASTERELELIKKRLNYGVKFADHQINSRSKREDGFIDFSIGDAIGVYKEDDGDYRPTYYFYTLDFVRNQFNIFLKDTE